MEHLRAIVDYCEGRLDDPVEVMSQLDRTRLELTLARTKIAYFLGCRCAATSCRARAS